MAADNGLSALQLDVMRAVWALGEARVAEVRAHLDSRGLAATTVATLLTRLEKRGLLAHRTEGRQYVYRALKSEQEISETMVSELTTTLFDGEASQLVSHLLRKGEFAPADLAEIKRLIANQESGEG
jgi:BlaI family transcriptional regulator, penicillinase repressor